MFNKYHKRQTALTKWLEFVLQILKYTQFCWTVTFLQKWRQQIKCWLEVQGKKYFFLYPYIYNKIKAPCVPFCLAQIRTLPLFIRSENLLLKPAWASSQVILYNESFTSTVITHNNCKECELTSQIKKCINTF